VRGLHLARPGPQYLHTLLITSHNSYNNLGPVIVDSGPQRRRDMGTVRVSILI
jgi:hypothetical protein